MVRYPTFLPQLSLPKNVHSWEWGNLQLARGRVGGGEGNGLKGRLIFPHVPHTRSPPPCVPQLLRSSHAVSLWQRTEGTVQVPRGPAVALGSTFPVRPGSLSLPGPCCVTSDKGLDLSSALNLPLTPIVKSQLGRESGSHSPCRVRD